MRCITRGMVVCESYMRDPPSHTFVWFPNTWTWGLSTGNLLLNSLLSLCALGGVHILGPAGVGSGSGAAVRAWQIPGYVAPGYRSPRDPGWRAAGGEEGRRGGWVQGSENRRLYKVPE